MSGGTQVGGYFRSLEAIRGIAALAIVLYHLDDRLGLPFYFDNFYIGVDLFFVLSGFVIFHVYGGQINDRTGYARFLWLRFARVYPLHFATLLAFVAFQAAVSAVDGSIAQSIEPLFAHNDIWSFIGNVLAIHGLNVFSGPTFNIPSWSISTELYTYALFGALFWAGLIRSDKPFVASILIVVAAYVVLATKAPQFHVMQDLGFIRNVLNFALGIVARGIYALLQAPSTRMLTVLQGSALALLLILLAVPVRVAPHAVYTAPILCAILILACAYDRAGLCPILLLAPLQWLGRISYSLYLTHYMLVLLVSASYLAAVQHGLIANALWKQWALNPVVAAIALAIAHVTYRHLELPSRAFLRALWQPGNR